MTGREDLQEAWDGWGKMALLIAIAVVVIALRVLGVVGDVDFASGLTVAAWGIGGIAAVWSAWPKLVIRKLRAVAVLVVALAAGTAMWVPWVAFGPNAALARGTLPAADAIWTGPTFRGGHHVITVEAVPVDVKAAVEVRLGTGPGAKVLKGSVTSRQMSKRQATMTGNDIHSLNWRLPDEVFGKPLLVSLREESSKSRIRWPAQVTIRQALPGSPPFAIAAVVLLLLGAWLDGRATRLRPTYLATYAVAACTFGPVLSALYSPHDVTRSVFFALFLATFVGAAAGGITVPAFRKKPPSPTSAA